MKKDYTNIAIIGAAVVVILAVGGWLFMRNRTDTPARNTNATSTGATSTKNTDTTTAGGKTVTTASSGESVSVDDQKAGKTVSVAAMSISKISWVAIYDVEARRTLGAARFHPGTEKGTVPLLKPTVAGKEYRAVVYIDDGDRAFGLYKDAQVEGVSDTFKATE